MPVAVDGDGESPVLRQLAQDPEVAGGVFLETEGGHGDLAGGVIDRPVEDEAGAAALQPVVVTTVHLHEQPREARGEEEAADGRAERTSPCSSASISVRC
jgi:hypothetical protein